jgi:hypothetical protein
MHGDRGQLRLSLVIPPPAVVPPALRVKAGATGGFDLCLPGFSARLAPGQSGIALETDGGCSYRLRTAANFSQAVTFVMVAP